MEIVILVAIAIAATATAVVVASRLVAKKIIDGALRFDRVPAAYAYPEKLADGTYPAPAASPDFFYGSLDAPAREHINEQRAALDQKRLVWAESHRPTEVHVKAEDGIDLAGYLYMAAEPSRQWAVCVHGYLGSHAEMEAVAMHYVGHGYNALAIDLRCHGASEGSIIGFGWTDRRDIVAWCSLLTERFGEDISIVVHGWSLGGASVMAATGEADLAPQVKACIEDCGFICMVDLIPNVFKGLPKPLIGLITSPIRSWIKRECGFDIMSARNDAAVSRSHVPTLFIHGSHDALIKPADMDTLFDACAAPKDRVLFQNAGHCQSVVVDTEAYFKHVFAFIDSVEKGAKA